eukprot:5460748-Amphidinium_carterae.1
MAIVSGDSSLTTWPWATLEWLILTSDESTLSQSSTSVGCYFPRCEMPKAVHVAYHRVVSNIHGSRANQSYQTCKKDLLVWKVPSPNLMRLNSKCQHIYRVESPGFPFQGFFLLASSRVSPFQGDADVNFQKCEDDSPPYKCINCISELDRCMGRSCSIAHATHAWNDPSQVANSRTCYVFEHQIPFHGSRAPGLDPVSRTGFRYAGGPDDTPEEARRVACKIESDRDCRDCAHLESGLSNRRIPSQMWPPRRPMMVSRGWNLALALREKSEALVQVMNIAQRSKLETRRQLQVPNVTTSQPPGTV